MSLIPLRQQLALDLFKPVVKDLTKHHQLRQIFWESTLRCNMHCLHCGSDCKTSALHKDMPFEDFEKVLLRVSQAYDPHKISIVITGGEPLMRADLARCGRRMYELEFFWGLVSNGLLMTERKIDELLGSGMRSATISLDGLREQHVWLRGVEGAFDNATKAIGILANEPAVKFDVVTCVNKRNISVLEELKELLISLGVKSWRLFTIFPAGRAADNPDLQLSQEEYRIMLDFIAATRKEGRIAASHACEGFLGPYEGKVRDNFFVCYAGRNVAGVRIDGSISGCTSIRSALDQGNIYKDDFVDVWENRFRNMRDRTWMKTGICADCRFWKWCEGNGLHLRDAEGRLMRCNLELLGLK